MHYFLMRFFTYSTHAACLRRARTEMIVEKERYLLASSASEVRASWSCILLNVFTSPATRPWSTPWRRTRDARAPARGTGVAQELTLKFTISLGNGPCSQRSLGTRPASPPELHLPTGRLRQRRFTEMDSPAMTAGAGAPRGWHRLYDCCVLLSLSARRSV